MKTQLYYTIESRDRDGKLLKRMTRKAHSFLRAYNEIVGVQVRASSVSITDTGGNARTVGLHANNLTVYTTAGVTDYGIRVGGGIIAVDISDHALGTPIDEGTGPGQLSHQTMTSTAPSVSGSTCSFTISRVMINGSGAAITVTEIGMYCKAASTPYYFCIVRDVLLASVAIPDGGALTVVYTSKVTV